MNWLERRHGELLELWRKDPVKLLALYRSINHLTVDCPLPDGVSIASIVNALLGHELSKRSAAVLKSK